MALESKIDFRWRGLLSRKHYRDIHHVSVSVLHHDLQQTTGKKENNFDT